MEVIPFVRNQSLKILRELDCYAKGETSKGNKRLKKKREKEASYLSSVNWLTGNSSCDGKAYQLLFSATSLTMLAELSKKKMRKK